MKPLAIVTFAAESALGSGASAVAVAPVGQKARSAIGEDPELVSAGMRRPFAARAAAPLAPGVDRAAGLLERVLASLVKGLDEALPAWRDLRVAVALGTSSGGMLSLIRALTLLERGEPVPRELARATPYFGPLGRLEAVLGMKPVERTQVLAACASSGMAIGLGSRWIEQERADLVIAGGYDAVSVLVASGFECLGATSATRPSPFRKGRDGMALGEGAGLIALTRADRCSRPLGYVRGFGAASDAVHITAPDREGRGLARAASLALNDASVAAADVDLVSAHATATSFNDAAEARALRAVLADHADAVVVHPFKAVIGHTLGAGSVLELLSALGACTDGVLPAAAGEGEMDPDASVRLLERSAPGSSRCTLGLSAAFGGASTATVCGLDAGRGAPRPRRAVTVRARGRLVTELDRDVLGPILRADPSKLSRLDAASSLAVGAAGSVLLAFGGELPEPTAIVVGTATASLENDELFHGRIRARGVRAAEPRRFPPTSPNLVPGQCSIAFGLRGPSLAVGWDLAAPLEALLVGADLVESGDAAAAVVVAIEHVGLAVPALWSSAGWPCPRHAAAAILLMPAGADEPRLDRDAVSRLRADLARTGTPDPAQALLDAAEAALA